jgi:hypothetical protein
VENTERLLIGALFIAAASVRAAETTVAEPPAGDVLLLDSLGRPVPTPVERLPEGLRPRSEANRNNQTPPTHKGAKAPEELGEKLDSLREGLPEYEWFPAVSPALMPYLYNLDEFGNTVARPGPFVLGLAHAPRNLLPAALRTAAIRKCCRLRSSAGTARSWQRPKP